MANCQPEMAFRRCDQFSRPSNSFFPDLVLSDDAANRPLSVCPDGHIFLETFSPHYKPAYDFLIGIAEPVSRPRYVYEYQITLFSMYAAVSIGLGADEIIRVLTLLSKCKISSGLVHKVISTIKAVGKQRLILEDNRFFVESTDLALLQRIANDDEISRYRVQDRNPSDHYDEDTGFIVADSDDNATVVPGVGDVSVYRTTREFGVDAQDTAHERASARRRRSRGASRCAGRASAACASAR
jgi:DNA excision repair protein ERCC-3